MLLQASWWKGVLSRDSIGIADGGVMTVAEITYDLATGLSEQSTFITSDGLVYNSFPMAEYVHLALFTLALNGDKFARRFFEASNIPSTA
jgi:hypothetical protein